MTLIKAEWRGYIFFIRLGKLRINPEKPGLVPYLTVNYHEEKVWGKSKEISSVLPLSGQDVKEKYLRLQTLCLFD